MASPSQEMLLDSEGFYTALATVYSSLCDERTRYIEAVDCLVKQTTTSRKGTGSAWLDVGAGDGVRIADLTSDFAGELWLIEPAKPLAKMAKESVPDSIVLEQTLEDAAGSPTLKGKQFDVITCLWNVIGHVDDPKKFLREVGRLIDSKGILIIDVNNRHNVKQYGIGATLRNMLMSIFKTSTDKWRFPVSKSPDVTTLSWITNAREIEALANDAGLRLVRRLFVDYETGKTSRRGFWRGQIYYEFSRNALP